MADSSAMADIRGINVDKIAKGFADEAIIFKQYCILKNTSNREIRWYQKTAGFLDSTDTTGMTASRIQQASSLALPEVAEQTWTRNTSHVRKYMVESPWISNEDTTDNDVSLLATTVRDLSRAVAYQVDNRIINVISESFSAAPSNILSGTATADGWDDDATGDPITDILAMKAAIRAQGYNPEGAVMILHSTDFKNLIRHLIVVKGSSIPSFSSEAVRSGMVMEVLGVKIVVSENTTTDFAIMFIPNVSVTWYQFAGLTATTIVDEGIGKKVRVWELGEAVLNDPKSVYSLDQLQE